MPTPRPLTRRELSLPVPAWLPKALLDRCGGTVYSLFRFSDAERAVLRKRRPEAPSAWAEKNRIVRMSSIPGRWQNIITPYLAPLLDGLRFPGVEMGIICKGPQTAVTEGAINILGHSAEHAPGPAMVVYADKDTAKDIMRDRIMPMFEDSRRLRRYLTGAVGDESTIRVNLRHMVIFLGWAGSVARMGSRPIRLLILDEIDKYPESRKEASPEALAEKRTITWRGRRLILKFSTPTVENGPIWVAFTEEAHARFDFHVACPSCGAMQVMLFDGIRWPEDARDPEVVLKDRLAVYQCAHCPAVWDDADRDMAVRGGQWVERGSGLELFSHLETHRPGKIGFHIPSWLSYFVSLSEVAHAFLKWKKSGRLKDLKDFMNQHKAEPWQERRAERQEDAILALCDDRPRGIVPGPVDGVPRVAALVAGIDTQAAYFRYVIRAYGFGETEESWLIQAGTAQAFSALDELIWKNVYRDAQGNEYRVKAAVIDAMGAPGRTKQVYAWCAKRPQAMAYQGKQNQATPIAYSPLEFFPDVRGSKIKIPGGLLRRRVDTTFFKSDLAEKLTIAPGDPGTFWLHSDVAQRRNGVEHEGLLLDYAREMCAEVFNPETLAWENPKQKPNHFWDCEIMCLVAAWELGLRHRRPPGKDKQAIGKATPAPMPARNLSAGERLALRRR
ncbi:MAG: phage terminase large subunit family protein [Desulfobulbus sp.]|nr:phage terminase large subunit family protein [Desulfobulbus sp.]